MFGHRPAALRDHTSSAEPRPVSRRPTKTRVASSTPVNGSSPFAATAASVPPGPSFAACCASGACCSGLASGFEVGVVTVGGGAVGVAVVARAGGGAVPVGAGGGRGGG